MRWPSKAHKILTSALGQKQTFALQKRTSYQSEKNRHQSASLHGYAGRSISGTRYAPEMGI